LILFGLLGGDFRGLLGGDFRLILFGLLGGDFRLAFSALSGFEALNPNLFKSELTVVDILFIVTNKKITRQRTPEPLTGQGARPTLRTLDSFETLFEF